VADVLVEKLPPLRLFQDVSRDPVKARQDFLDWAEEHHPGRLADLIDEWLDSGWVRPDN
jgi:hypothetical protein